MLAVPALALAGHRDLVELALAGETAAYLVPADRVPDEAPPLTVDSGGAISGSVPRVLAGDTAVRFVVPVVAPGTEQDTPRAAGGRELRLVDAGAPGITRTRRKLLDRSRSVADVRFDRAPSQRLTLTAGPAEVLRQASARAAVLVAADSLGASARMLDLAVTYSKQRRQFGVPIGSFQAVKHKAADMYLAIERARVLAYYAALTIAEDDPGRHRAAVMAKAAAGECQEVVYRNGTQLFGAMGFTWENELHVYLKRAVAANLLLGSATAHRKALLEMEAAAL
jgi:alkylation response protein AidB-like acyl-CoA dehydrogenase